MFQTPPPKRVRISQLSQALTQVHTVTRTYAVVDLTVYPPQEEVVSVVDEVTPPTWNCYCLRKNHDNRYPDKYLRAKRGLSMTEANPRRWFYACSKPRCVWIYLFPSNFSHFLLPSKSMFMYIILKYRLWTGATSSNRVMNKRLLSNQVIIF
jgi:hypothetical protein